MIWTVVMEWDGEKPPTTYYNRLHSYGFRVRGDKEKNPIARRVPWWNAASSMGKGVIIQESVVVCDSESLARLIYDTAVNNGAKNVQMFSGDAVDKRLTVEDAKIMAEIEGKLGRRGRPAKDSKVNWVVTCYEKCNTQTVEESVHVVNCPCCGGTRIYAREGEMPSYKFPSGDIFDAWKRHRFASGRFEVANDGDQEPPQSVAISDAKEAKTIEVIRKSKGLLNRLSMVNPRIARSILDAVFASRTYLGEELRQEARVRAFVDMTKRGAGTTDVSLIESNDHFDLIDAAAVIGPAKIASLWETTKEKS